MNEQSGIEEDSDPSAVTVPLELRRRSRGRPTTNKSEAEPLYNHLRHKMFVMVALIFIPLLIIIVWIVMFLIGLVLMAFVGMIGSVVGAGGGAPGEILGIWIPLLVSVVATLWFGQKLLHRYVLWKYRFLRITEDVVSLPTEIESDLLILVSGVKNDHPVIPRSKDLTARVTQGWWGRKFGFAKVSFDGPGQKDTQFHNMRFIDKPERIKELFPK